MRVDVKYETQWIRGPKYPESEWHFFKESGIPFTNLKHEVAVVTVTFDNVERVSIEKLGLLNKEVSYWIWYEEDPKQWAYSKPINNAGLPLSLFLQGPVRLNRRTLADAQMAVDALKAALSEVKTQIAGAGRGKTESFEI